MLKYNKNSIYRLFLGMAITIVVVCLFASCGAKREEPIVAPWGEVTDSEAQDSTFDLEQITANGEMIALTVSGPDTYYDYHGKHLGEQYLLCQKFADKIGVSLRMEICRDTLEMLRRLLAGEGDVVACDLSKSKPKMSADSLAQVRFCGSAADTAKIGWAVSKDKPRLADAISEWYKPTMLAEVRKEERFLLSSRSVKRRVFAPMLNRKGGIISRYDAYFIAYARPIRWDWKLLAAQCYQESTFDPQARSWAGACGLMQIMPSTADELGLPQSRIYDPESNISAATKLLAQLERKFSDVANRQERMKFVLASYNGGFFHVRDAMALTKKHGGNQYSWSDVSRYILLLSSPQYYRDPVVKYGYMRGTETADYVERILQRWASYRGVKTPRLGFSPVTPQKAKHQRKKKFQN